jgi:protease-4
MSTTPHPEGTPPPQPAAAAQVAPPGAIYYYPAPPPPPRRGFWGRLFLTFFVLIIGGSFFLNLVLLAVNGSLVGDGTPHVQEKYVSHDKNAEDKIVILPIEGVIMDGEEGFVKRAIDTAMDDKHVKAVVLRVDSPGGTVNASDYIYHHLCDLAKTKKIPIVVSMGGMAASGGYYVSMAAGPEPGRIFAEPTCTTGSIGVVLPHYNFAGLMEKYGVADDSVASHHLKEMGSPFKTMTPEEKQIFQDLIDDNFKKFKEVVHAGRSNFEKKGDEPDPLDKLATGQVFTAHQAKENGLIDEIGYLEDAVAKAIKLADLDAAKVRVVRYFQEPSLRSILLNGQASKSESAELKALFDMTTPKAYYLDSWLPELAAAAK